MPCRLQADFDFILSLAQNQDVNGGTRYTMTNYERWLEKVKAALDSMNMPMSD